MPRFRPPEEMRASAGELHFLDENEVNWIGSVFTWNEIDEVYELAPGADWSDYVDKMRELEPWKGEMDG